MDQGPNPHTTERPPSEEGNARTTERLASEEGARKIIGERFVSLFKELVGRGPSAARTYLAEDLVIVVLENTLTKGEKTLAGEERPALVRELRRTYQRAMSERAEQIVTEITGRSVHVFLSDHSVFPDFAVEAFVLEPEDPASGPGLESLATNSKSHREGHRQISRAMVSLFKEQVGRGPTHARTYANSDLVAVLLEDTLTPAEHSLANDDSETLVREIRRHFQGTLRDRAVEIVERELGDRVVKAFLSDSSVHPDYSIEVFLLEHREPESAIESSNSA
jgi:uncharacterized protein YbcI